VSEPRCFDDNSCGFFRACPSLIPDSCRDRRLSAGFGREWPQLLILAAEFSLAFRLRPISARAISVPDRSRTAAQVRTR
jgi:hypothetical protein